MRGRRVRAGIDTDKLDLLERFGAQMLATARRYSANSQDAEDAYQRASEILLTHEPTGSDDDLCRWLRTTVKHEALAIRRRQERVLPSGPAERVQVTGVNPADTAERAERFERLRQGAQALGRLKPQEVRCLRLRAEGYSYREICELTGWSYTKVNRCLTEGRRAFLERLAGIESGAECERLAPALSAVADGEAKAADLALLRPHLRHCPACRARLREYRAVPARVAALVPAAILAPGGPSSLRTLFESAVGALQDRAAALGERGHQAIELAAGQKVAAVATSAAIASGGGVAAERLATQAPAGAARPHRAAKAPERPRRRMPERRRAMVTPTPRPQPKAQPVQPTPAPVAPGARGCRAGTGAAGVRAGPERHRNPRRRRPGPPRPPRRAGAASSRPSGSGCVLFPAHGYRSCPPAV